MAHQKETMITAGVLNFFYVILFGVMSPILLLADVPSNNNITGAIVAANGYLAGVPFPYFLASVFATLAFITVFEAAYWAYKLLRWLWRKIPLAGLN